MMRYDIGVTVKVLECGQRSISGSLAQFGPCSHGLSRALPPLLTVPGMRGFRDWTRVHLVKACVSRDCARGVPAMLHRFFSPILPSQPGVWKMGNRLRSA